MEENILLFIQDTLRTPFFTVFFRFITALGDSGFIWILAIVLLLLFKKTRKIGIICAVSLLVSFVLNNLLLKNLIARVRPYDALESLRLLVKAPSDFSFPSGHSANSFAVASVLFLSAKKRYGIPALILATLIAFSRLYLGVHYPTDVLFGIFSGSVIGSLTCYFLTDNKHK